MLVKLQVSVLEVKLKEREKSRVTRVSMGEVGALTVPCTPRLKAVSKGSLLAKARQEQAPTRLSFGGLMTKGAGTLSQLGLGS